MKTINKKNKIMAIDKNDGEIFYGEDAIELMKELSKKKRGHNFKIEVLDPSIKFLMKKGI